MTSRAVVATDVQSDPQDWKLVTKEKPRASPGHVVVRMTLRPINPVDVEGPKLFLGHLQGKDPVVGSEGVGYVEEVGEGVTNVKVGKRVVPSFGKEYLNKGNGSWQDYVEVPEDKLCFVPDSLSDDIAAQFIINPWVAYGLLQDQDVPKGEYLLTTAAGSALGRQLIQMAKHWGIKTINVVRRDELKEELKSIGADEVINSTTEDVLARVKEITGGKGVYGAVDAVAGKQPRSTEFSSCVFKTDDLVSCTVVSCVRDGGQVFIYGFLGSPEVDVTVGVFDLNRVKMKFWTTRFDREREREVAREVSKLLEDKVIVPLSGKTFKLEAFKEALLEADRSGGGGKVFLGT